MHINMVKLLLVKKKTKFENCVPVFFKFTIILYFLIAVMFVVTDYFV